MPMTGVDSLFRYSCCSVALAERILPPRRMRFCHYTLTDVARRKAGLFPRNPIRDHMRMREPDTDAEPHHSHPLLLAATMMTLSSSNHNQYELPPSNLPALISRSARLPDGSCWVNHRSCNARRCQYVDIRPLHERGTRWLRVLSRILDPA